MASLLPQQQTQSTFILSRETRERGVQPLAMHWFPASALPDKPHPLSSHCHCLIAQSCSSTSFSGFLKVLLLHVQSDFSSCFSQELLNILCLLEHKHLCKHRPHFFVLLNIAAKKLLFLLLMLHRAFGRYPAEQCH